MSFLSVVKELFVAPEVTTKPVLGAILETPQYTKVLRLMHKCGHWHGSYATDVDGTSVCIECYSKRFSMKQT